MYKSIGHEIEIYIHCLWLLLHPILWSPMYHTLTINEYIQIPKEKKNKWLNTTLHTLYMNRDGKGKKYIYTSDKISLSLDANCRIVSLWDIRLAAPPSFLTSSDLLRRPWGNPIGCSNASIAAGRFNEANTLKPLEIFLKRNNEMSILNVLKRWNKTSTLPLIISISVTNTFEIWLLLQLILPILSLPKNPSFQNIYLRLDE